MNGSFKLGTAFGIPIFLHWSFLALSAFLLLANPASAIWLPILCGCVLLHELGHSVTARHFGIRVVDITLLPIGGMARMAEMPENARVEGLVAFAGPAVNFVLALIGFVALWAGALLGWNGLGLAGSLFLYVNLVLGLFNLIPAFPMDGGRILRAFLARRRNWVDATEGAVRTGRWIALFMAIAPFLLPRLFPTVNFGFSTLPFIALFVWFAGGRELIGVRLRHGLPPLKSMQFAGARAEDFAPFGTRPPAPTQATSSPPPPRANEVEVEPGHARRPAVWDETVEAHIKKPRRGFDTDDIQVLERFHGRIRRPRSEPGDA